MKLKDIITEYTNKKNKERVVGSYYASEVGSIIMGYQTPEDFFKPKAIQGYNARLIQEGISIENHLSMIFKEMGVDYETQVRKEVKVSDNVVIVVKTDYVFPDFVAELKRPREKSTNIPDKWKYQLEITYQAFKKPIQLWQCAYPMDITAIHYEPSEPLFKEICEKMLEYHEKVKKVELKLNKQK